MEEERVWAVVLLGLGLLLGLLGSCLHLKDEAERLKLKLCSFLVKSWNHQGCPKRPRGGASPCAHTSLVLASPFSEWFSSFASASAFSFAFLVFLSSFLSFTAFSFCSGLDTSSEHAEHLQTPSLHPRILLHLASHLRRLLHLWFRLGRGRFLGKEEESDVETATLEYSSTTEVSMIV